MQRQNMRIFALGNISSISFQTSSQTIAMEAYDTNTKALTNTLYTKIIQ